MSFVIGIDPGLNGTGMAIWNDGIVAFSTSNRRKTQTLEQRIDQLTNDVYDFVASYDEAYTIIEMPQYMETKQVSARSGSLVKLCIATGVIAGTLSMLEMVYRLIPVNQWKGELPKSVVDRRVLRHLTTHDQDWYASVSQHARDALALAIWHDKGKL